MMRERQSLRSYLARELQSKITDLQKQLAEHQGAQDRFPSHPSSHACYRVHLRSLWEEHGETSVDIDHLGSLEEAITLAEDKFMQTNARSDVQAEYSVEAILGVCLIPVPEHYWTAYKKTRSL